MTTREIIEQIMTGQSVCPATIRNHNADRVMAWVRATEMHHTADNCTSRKRKDCAHAPGVQTAEFAAVIASEATNACTCGQHGTDDPVAVARIGREFVERWT